MISIKINTGAQTNHGTGFALLITLIVVSVVVSIGLTLLDLTIKQVRLASGSKDSEIAFHAANAGVECARYWRRIERDDFEAGQAVSVGCFGAANSSYTATDLTPASPVAIYEYNFSFTGGTNNDRCSVVKMITLSSEPDASAAVVLNGVDVLIPGYPASSKSCQPGGRCTIISAQGYNKACINKDTIGTVQREVLLEL